MLSRPLASVLALASMLAAPLGARAATWELDPAHSSVQFSVRHLMISNVKGEFTKLSGTITGDESAPTSARIDATIDTTSIDTRNAKRDDHVRGPDFLDTARFPTMTFRSSKIEPAGDDRWKITGDLTLHGVTKPVVLDVTATAPRKDPWGKLRAGAQATTTINRQDFGVRYNSALEGGGVVVGDEVTITIDAEAVRKPD
jgi:polyisoprenoid-binding protein YceI